MTRSDDRALAVLTALLRVCRDSVEGYATAVRDIPDVELRRELERFRSEREKAVEALVQRIVDLRGDPNVSTTVPGALHRGWMDARAASAENPNQAILVEVERGEGLAVDAFRGALQEQDLDAATVKLFRQQYELVQAAHDRVKQLRDRSAYSRVP